MPRDMTVKVDQSTTNGVTVFVVRTHNHWSLRFSDEAIAAQVAGALNAAYADGLRSGKGQARAAMRDALGIAPTIGCPSPFINPTSFIKEG
jgi:hypothetical protein